mgnify:CR=1 FL=1
MSSTAVHHTTVEDTFEYDHSRSSSSSTSSTSSENSWGIILPQLYEEAFGSFPSRLVLRQMFDWVELTSLDVLRYALQEAACAPAPSWRYALAILRDCNGLHVTAKPGQSLRIAVETARGARIYEERKRKRLIYSDDETRLPWEE